MSVKQNYKSRKPGTNPRTGEELVPWQTVQVLDPEIPPLHTFEGPARIQTEFGSRVQVIQVRVPRSASMYDLTLATERAARYLGFTPVGEETP